MQRPDPPPQSAQATRSAARRPLRCRSSTSDINTKQSESAKRRGDLTSSLNNITQHRRRGQEEEEGRTSTTRQLLQRSSTDSSRRRSSINSNGDISNQTLEQVRRVFEKKRSEKTLELERPSVPHVPSRRPPPNRRHSMQDDTRGQHHRNRTRVGKEDERPADLTSFFDRKGSGGSGRQREEVVSYKVGDTLKCSTHSLRFSSTE